MNFAKARQALLQGRKNEVYKEIAGANDPQDVNCLIALYHYSKDKEHITPISEALKRINSPDAVEFLSLPEAERQSIARSRYNEYDKAIINQFLSPALVSENSTFIPPAWEYCVIGPIMCDNSGHWNGFHPKIVRFTGYPLESRVVIDLAKLTKENASLHNTMVLEASIAELGRHGWEMVGLAPIDTTRGLADDKSSTLHYIYFKRKV